MSLEAIIEQLGIPKSVCIAVVILLTLIQIAPIKVNPWGWIGKKIGRLLNGEVLDRVEKLEKNLQEQSVLNCRIRILRFGDELMRNIKHSRDHFEQTLRDIDNYEKYCRDHPDYVNNVTEATISQIKSCYQERRMKNDFD